MKKLDSQLAKKMANAIRFLSIDAVEKAKSGHPGMPMGIADVATILYNEFLKFNPKDPHWPNRDRFVLSAGHGSMLVYSLLYLTGHKDISIEDIKNFRQLHSKTAGHPEYGELEAIETTTGPLGQGIANAVGMALAEKMLAARFGNEIVDHKTYCIVGDGCLMEGISYEAISLAGHLGLSKLIVLWDNNSISIDGSTNLSTSEDMKLRFKSCNWKVIEIDGHDFEQIRKALKQAGKSDKPVMISCKTTIAYGSPNKSGSEKSHGSPLGADEIIATRKNLDWNYDPFVVPDEILNKWRDAGKTGLRLNNKWKKLLSAAPETLRNEFLESQKSGINLDAIQNKIEEFKQNLITKKPHDATRKSSGNILELLTKENSKLIGGSADLTGSVNTKTASTKPITKTDFSGRYIHYGIREHAMGAIMNGIALHKGFIPYSGTFLVFSDYMKPAIRLSALMKQQVIYVLTHDSIGLGEDGPTHQPIEHLASLRSIPNLNVFRPADAIETVACYELALKNTATPSAMVLTRQNVGFFRNEYNQNDPALRGGYVLAGSHNSDLVILATGSEVTIAMEAREKLANQEIDAKVVSLPCLEIFESQSDSYKKEVLAAKGNLKVAVEAGVRQGWDHYLGNNGIFIGMNSFGASAKYEDLYEYFGITADNIVKNVIAKLR